MLQFEFISCELLLQTLFGVKNQILQVDILSYLGCLVIYVVVKNVKLIILGLIPFFQLFLNGNET